MHLHVVNPRWNTALGGFYSVSQIEWHFTSWGSCNSDVMIQWIIVTFSELSPSWKKQVSFCYFICLRLLLLQGVHIFLSYSVRFSSKKSNRSYLGYLIANFILSYFLTCKLCHFRLKIKLCKFFSGADIVVIRCFFPLQAIPVTVDTAIVKLKHPIPS